MLTNGLCKNYAYILTYQVYWQENLKSSTSRHLSLKITNNNLEHADLIFPIKFIFSICGESKNNGTISYL